MNGLCSHSRPIVVSSVCPGRTRTSGGSAIRTSITDRRTGILAEEHRKRIFNVRNPQSERIFLVDGRVAGAWRYDSGRVTLEPFGRLARAARAELEDEAERLAAFHA